MNRDFRDIRLVKSRILPILDIPYSPEAYRRIQLGGLGPEAYRGYLSRELMAANAEVEMAALAAAETKKNKKSKEDAGGVGGGRGKAKMKRKVALPTKFTETKLVRPRPPASAPPSTRSTRHLLKHRPLPTKH